MKSTILISLILAAAATSAAEIRDLRLIISPYLPGEQTRALKAETISQLLTKVPSGAQFTVIDGWQLREVVRLTVPGGEPAARKRQLRLELLRLLEWFEVSETNKSAWQRTALLRLPESLEIVGPGAGQNAAIVFIGSPIYFNPAEPDFSFSNPVGAGESVYRLPGHGLLGLTHDESIWGVLDVRTRLRGATVHLLYPSESIFPARQYRAEIKEFLGLYLELQQGRLASFQSDPKELFRQWLQPNLGPVGTYRINRTNAPYAMIEFRRPVPTASVSDSPSSPIPDVSSLVPLAQTNQSPVTDRPLAPSTDQVGQKDAMARFEEAAKQHEAPVSVGITWDQTNVDLDLYVFEGGEPKPLFFGNSTNRQGRFLQDYRDATGGGLEQVILYRNVTPRFEAWVNLHSVVGEVLQPITGKVILRSHERTEVWRFEMAAKKGNQGGGRDMRERSPSWQKVAVSSTNGGKKVAD